MKKITVIGAGSFGTALAILLTDKGYDVSIWGRSEEQLALMREKRENPHYLPGVKLSEKLNIEGNLKSALINAEIIVFSVPAQNFRSVLESSREYIKSSSTIVNVAKGIEKKSLLRLSQVAEDVIPDIKYVTLSGPSHAEEVARNLPTTVTVASLDNQLSKEIQEVFNTERFRVYTNDDIIGVELGGALKNIIALGAGISDGMGFGDNAKAAIMTRGITEMCRLGLAMGANMNTFSGLTGIGDLIVTCTSMHSRNRRCGILMGEGISTDKAVEKVGMVVEGISTAEAAYELAKLYNIEMPLTECICQMIKGEIDALEAVSLLMGRKTKNEMHI
ncbi:MAG: NAD(P)H-dependent glycerol-3-phosphate dehydrogenase [Firmicutes bacterium]|nr:NAD(P)H-dependent glycerol-3-phosphate dehydrogenase [Bacillota bacterium]